MQTRLARPLAAAALCLLPLVGCASRGDALEGDQPPPSAALRVPFVAQEGSFDCGLAAARSLLAHKGIEHQAAALQSELLPQAERGTSGLEFALALYRRGLFPVVREDADPTWIEACLGAQEPVVVLLATPLARQQALFHYVVVTGADSERYWLHDGAQPNACLSREAFRSQWRLAGGWALVAIDPTVAPQGALPLMATEQARIAYLAQERGRPELAALRYRAALQLDPTLRAARSNLAGVLLDLGRPSAAIAELELALGQAPDEPSLLNDLAWAIYVEGKLEPRAHADSLARGESLALRACELAPPELQATCRDTLAQLQRLRARRTGPRAP